MKKGAKGIDISEHNSGLNYTQMSKGLDFVIIRDGYGHTQDKLFKTHVAGFKALGMPIETYHFLYCTTAAGARENAEAAVRFVQAAGLPKTTRIWCDLEYDTVDKAKDKGVILGAMEINLFTRTFCEAVKAAGHPTGIYTNLDYRARFYTADTINKYPLWLAAYTKTCPVACEMWQYSNSNGKLDLDMYMGAETPATTPADAATTPVNAPTAPANAAGYSFTVGAVKSGTKGENVKLLQNILRGMGYSGRNLKPLTSDGIAGENTIYALRCYQQTNRLQVDGICGAKTWAKLLGV